MQRRDRRATRAGWGLGLLSALASLLLIAGLFAFNQSTPVGRHPNPKDQDSARKKFTAMPLYFERNVGQSDPGVRYLSHTSRYSLFLTDDAAVITLVGGSANRGRTAVQSPPALKNKLIESAIRIRLVGANTHPQFEALDPLPGRVNYLIGSDPSKYHRNVPIFGRVKLKNVYPGVDLVYYGTPQALEYDLIAAPGADTSKLRFAVEGPAKTSVAMNGNLVVVTAAGVIVLEKPRVYQQDAAGGTTPIEGAFALAGDGTIDAGIPRREVSFDIARYDHGQTLMIDPVIGLGPGSSQLQYSTYLGGTGSSTGPINLEQFSAISGGNLQLSIADAGTDVAVDPSNHAYVTGVAYSNDFPTKSAFQGTLAGANSPPKQNPNAFVSKFDYSLSGAASLIFSTYVGGKGDQNPADAGNGNGDFAFGIAADAGGNPFIVGQTYSTDFPLTATTCGAFGQTNNQQNQSTNVGFVAKLHNDGSTLDYSCYIDGSKNATEARVELAPAGCGTLTACKAYVAGSTQSDMTTGFPVTAGAFQKILSATNGKSAATFLVVHEDGQSLDYATLYGGTGNGTNAEAGLAVAVDPNTSNGFITGATYSSNLTLKGAQDAAYGGAVNQTSNVFVAEFAPAASGNASLVYATYLGGSGAIGIIPDILSVPVGDVGTGLAFDGTSNTVWVTGLTASTDFQVPGVAATVFQTTNQAAAHAGAPATAVFVTHLDPATAGPTGILYSTYFSGNGFVLSRLGGTIGLGDAPTGISLANGHVFITGIATSGVTAGSFPLSGNACFTANTSSGLAFSSVAVPVTSFVIELDPSQSPAASQLVFSTLLGGSGMANVTGGIQVDSNGLAVVAGLTYSTDFPVTTDASAAFQSTNATNPVGSQAFLSVLDPAGSICPSPTSTSTSTPTASPSPSASPSPTPTDSPSSTASPTSSPTASPSATDTPTSTPTTAPSATETVTATPTQSPLPTATPTSTSSTMATATASVAPTTSETPTVTSTPTPAPGGSVDLVEPASGGGKPGSTVGLGSFGYSPIDGNQQLVTTVSVTVSRPAIFSSLTLSAFLNAVPAGTLTINAPNITSMTIFTFSPGITIPSGGPQNLTFSLAGVISAGKSAGLEGMEKVKLAGITAGPKSGGTGALILSLSLLGFVIMPLSDKQRRRASIVAGAILLMATALAGCGGSSGGAPVANASTQQVIAMDVSEGGNQVGVANLPIDLGKIHKQ